MPVVTISRQNGSHGDELALYLAGKMGTRVVTRAELVSKVFCGMGDDVLGRLTESPKFFLNKPDGSDRSYKDMLSDEIRKNLENLGYSIESVQLEVPGDTKGAWISSGRWYINGIKIWFY